MAAQPIQPVSLDAVPLTGATFDPDAQIDEMYNVLSEIVFGVMTTTQINDIAIVGVLEMLKVDVMQHIQDAKYADEAYDE